MTIAVDSRSPVHIMQVRSSIFFDRDVDDRRRCDVVRGRKAFDYRQIV